MRQPIATLCSLCLLFWGYQTGLWKFAIPMALAVEARGFMQLRWTLPWTHLKVLHVLACVLGILSLLSVPATSADPLAYVARYHLLRCLPIALFPFILCYTYCTNFATLYRDIFKSPFTTRQPLNLYYPYFGLCLLSASATDGNKVVFLTVTVGLVMMLLTSLQGAQNPKSLPRFDRNVFYGLMGLALILSIFGTNQFYQLQGHFRPGTSLLGGMVQTVTSSVQGTLHNLLTTFNANSWQERLNSSKEVGDFEEGHGVDLNSDLFPEVSLAAPENSHGTRAPLDPSHSSNETNPPDHSPGLQAPNTSSATAESTITEGSKDNSGESSDGRFGEETQDGTQNSSPGGSAPGSPAIAPRHQDSLNSNAANGQSSSSGPRIKADAGSLQGIAQGAGGSVDPEQSVTQIGNTGSILPSNAILFRVAPERNPDSKQNSSARFPVLITEATYNHYQSGAWKAIKPKFVPKFSAPKQRRWILAPQTPDPTSIRIFTQLKNPRDTLKIPVGTSMITALVADAMEINQYGTVAIQGKPGPLAYTVTFDPTQSLGGPPTQADQVVPQREQEALQTILNTLNLKGKSDLETLQTISEFFDHDFTYSLNLPHTKSNKTPLAAFLMDHRSGHCEYYATATTLLLRAAGVPARYTVGYTAQEYSPVEKQYLVRSQDAHAWVTAYVQDHWITVDTTPGGATAPRETGQVGTAQAENTSALAGDITQAETQAEISWRDWLFHRASNIFNRASDSTSDSTSNRVSDRVSNHAKNTVWFLTIIVLGGAIALFTVVLIIWKLWVSPRQRRLRKRGFQPNLDQPQQKEPEFYLIEERLAAWNLKRRSSEPIMQWMNRLEQRLTESDMKRLKPIIDLHYRNRFDPLGLDSAEKEQLKTLIHSWLAECHQPLMSGAPRKRSFNSTI